MTSGGPCLCCAGLWGPTFEGPEMSGKVREPPLPCLPAQSGVGEKARLALPTAADGCAAQHPLAPWDLPNCLGAPLCCRALCLPKPAQ